MTMLNHQDKGKARAFITENAALFGTWQTNHDGTNDQFVGSGELFAAFIAFCSALGKINAVMSGIEALLKHAKTLLTFARELLAGEKTPLTNDGVQLEEGILALIYQNFMHSGKGLSPERIALLTNGAHKEIEQRLRRLEAGNLVRLGKSGWVPEI